MATHDYRVTDYGYIHSLKSEDFDAFLDTINPKNGDIILEAFCGYGETTQRLLEREKSQNISCDHYLSDASETQIKRAQDSLGTDPSVKSIQVADALKLPHENNFFDIVIVKMGLHEVPREMQTLVMRELFRVLKSGGKFITWEIALTDDKDQQRVFREVSYRKNELAGFYEINRNRYFQTEKDLIDLFEKTGFSEPKKVHDVSYQFESFRRKEEMVSVERKLLMDIKTKLDSQDEAFLEKLSQYRLDELNKSIKEIVYHEIKEKTGFEEIDRNNIKILTHKAIFCGVKP